MWQAATPSVVFLKNIFIYIFIRFYYNGHVSGSY
jgi:hypothetical protein